MALTAKLEIIGKKYAELLAKTPPKVIANEEEFDRRVAQLEALSLPERPLSAGEDALATLLERLIADYDDRFSLPEQPPHAVVEALMEQRGLNWQQAASMRPGSIDQQPLPAPSCPRFNEAGIN